MVRPLVRIKRCVEFLAFVILEHCCPDAINGCWIVDEDAMLDGGADKARSDRADVDRDIGDIGAGCGTITEIGCGELLAVINCG